MDDDVVYVAEHAIANLVRERLRQRCLFVSANVACLQMLSLRCGGGRFNDDQADLLAPTGMRASVILWLEHNHRLRPPPSLPAPLQLSLASVLGVEASEG